MARFDVINLAVTVKSRENNFHWCLQEHHVKYSGACSSKSHMKNRAFGGNR